MRNRSSFQCWKEPGTLVEGGESAMKNMTENELRNDRIRRQKED